MPQSTSKLHKLLTKRFLLVLGFVVVLAGGIGATLFLQNTGSDDVTNVDVVTKKVAQHMLLPTNETPALLTVTNSAKLTTDFLKQAKNGDKILIYENNKKAIIYRPSIDRIVAVGPIQIDPVQQKKDTKSKE